jgi:hypothetical protein
MVQTRYRSRTIRLREQHPQREYSTIAQKAFVADGLRDHYDQMAKERQGARTDLKPDIPVILPESKTSADSRDQAGKECGVSGAYVRFAFFLSQQCPVCPETAH